MAGVLDGIRVVEVAQWWFVPSGGAVLADWGADVVQGGASRHRRSAASGSSRRLLPADRRRQLHDGAVEPREAERRDRSREPARPGGPPSSGEGRRRVPDELPARGPQKLHIDVEDIRKVNPTIIYARGSGHGVRGPDIEKGGYDAASFWSRGGIAHALTPPGARRPIMQRAAFGDSAGGMTTAGGIAAALFHRERTGEPSVVDVSLLGTAMWILAPDIVLARFTDQEMPAFERTQAPNPIVNSYSPRTSAGLS
jgi:crotonobetainyl-CoA:carnitine CoA-transferase CaiB-like acyl-CoA transferase